MNVSHHCHSNRTPVLKQAEANSQPNDSAGALQTLYRLASFASAVINNGILIGISSALLAGSAVAAGGPVILGGDDLTDHGSRSSGVNQQGWLYIEKALANLDPNVNRAGPFTTDVAALGAADAGCSPPAPLNCGGGNAGGAIGAAADAAGLSVTFFEGATAINSFFTDLASGTVNPRIIWIAGTGAVNDLDGAEGAAITSNAASINGFVGSGGGLMAHGSGSTAYGWLTALLPGLMEVFGCTSSGATLTPEGIAAFPGLSNSDIDSNAGPCHSHFEGDFGGLEVLALDGSVVSQPLPGTGVTIAETEPNGTAPTSDTMAIGDDYTGVISPSNESDFVAFGASGGESIIAETVLTGLSDSTLQLLDQDGVTQLAFNDDFNGLASRIQFTLPPGSGTYFLAVRSFAGSSSGSYTLSLRLGGPAMGRPYIIGGAEVVIFESLTPALAFNPPGTDHTLTATVSNSTGDPVSDLNVDFDVTSGPNAGEAGVDTTDASGQAMFTYTDSGGIGADEIVASFVDEQGNLVNSNLALKFWDDDCQPNDIPDTCDIDCQGFGDACQVFDDCGMSADLDGNGQPDECNQPPDCSGTMAAPGLLWPPNHKFVDVSVVGATDPDGDPVTITIDSIFQDEPLDTVGDGNTCADGTGVGSSTASLRSERSGSRRVPGDGRVYHVSFTADDGQGGACAGTVTVCVPHDQSEPVECVDQGPLFDSTVCVE